MKQVKIGGLTVGNDQPLLVIAGPCQLESLDHALAGCQRGEPWTEAQAADWWQQHGMTPGVTDGRPAES